MKNFEVEFRAFVTKEKLGELREFLDTNSEDLGDDNKDTYFFILPDKLLKVVKNISKNTSKIVVKSNVLGACSGVEETEIDIVNNSVEDLVKLFKCLGFTRVIHSYQERRNYLYKGVEISLKHSEEWGYHVELEIMVAGEDGQSKAEEMIRTVAQELDLTLLTNEETADHAQKVIKAKITN